MKPFVVNRYGRIVFPYNFFPALDFSVFETLDQFAAVIRRDFEEKAPSEADIVARLEAGGYKDRYELLRDLALDLFWVNRYPFTMYDKQPMRWRDVPRQRGDIFLPIFKPWEGTEQAAAIESGYRNLVPTWDEGTENKIFRILFDVFRHKKGAGAELSPIKPTVAEIVANPANLTYHLLAWDPDYPGYGWDDVVEYWHHVPELEALMRRTMVLHNEYRWDRGKMRVIEVGKLHDDDFVVVYRPRNDEVGQFIRRVKGARRAASGRSRHRPSGHRCRWRTPKKGRPPVICGAPRVRSLGRVERRKMLAARREEPFGVVPDAGIKGRRKVIGSPDVRICSVTPSDGAASFRAFTCNGAMGSTRYDSTSTREISGTASLSTSRRLAASAEVIFDIPVRFPPVGRGCLRPGPHRVAESDQDDRDRAGCVLRRLSRRGSAYGDDVRLEAHTFSSECWKPLATFVRG